MTSFFMSLISSSLVCILLVAAIVEKFDVAAMQQQGQRDKQTLVDDGTGKVEIWRIENLEPQLVKPDLHGQFYSGDCYIVLYTYLKKGKEQYIIYFWLGQVGLALKKQPLLVWEE